MRSRPAAALLSFLLPVVFLVAGSPAVHASAARAAVAQSAAPHTERYGSPDRAPTAARHRAATPKARVGALPWPPPRTPRIQPGSGGHPPNAGLALLPAAPSPRPPVGAGAGPSEPGARPRCSDPALAPARAPPSTAR